MQNEVTGEEEIKEQEARGMESWSMVVCLTLQAGTSQRTLVALVWGSA